MVEPLSAGPVWAGWFIDAEQATQHDAPAMPAKPGSGPDAPRRMDIDLSILGSSAERFERCGHDVRKHNTWASSQYQEARARVPQSVLGRPRLCHGQAAAALLDTRAPIKLAAALSRRAQ